MIVYKLSYQSEVGEGEPGPEQPPKDHLVKRANSENKLRATDQKREDYGESYQHDLLAKGVLQGLIMTSAIGT